MGDEPDQPPTAAQSTPSTAATDDTTPTPPAGGPTAADPSVSSRTVDSNGDVAADVAAAEQLLARTLRQCAERAAGTDNPRRAREHLEAAREAAEALDALGY
uniref:hypothetical protein n=1 Tax=Haloarcula regularis TaxID=3033392 RepID=UPI0023E8B4EA|nr:hypothetical protein [Halomicroarcula sp. SYNS111]